MLKLAIFNKKGSSNNQIDIVDITDGVLKLSGGRFRLVLKSSSINFELRSEEEQDALIDIYEGFLNSIGFPLQFLIRTREIDMDDYLAELDISITNEPSSVYKKQLKSYKTFISSLITANKILSRQFYIIIPFDTQKSTDHSFVSEQLNLRADIVAKNLSRLGISTTTLSSVELIDLFYTFYSPEQSKLQPISDTTIKILDRDFITRGEAAC